MMHAARFPELRQRQRSPAKARTNRPKSHPVIAFSSLDSAVLTYNVLRLMATNVQPIFSVSSVVNN